MAVLTFCWTPVKKLTANNALFFLCKNGSWISVMKPLVDVVRYLGLGNGGGCADPLVG